MISREERTVDDYGRRLRWTIGIPRIVIRKLVRRSALAKEDRRPYASTDFPCSQTRVKITAKTKRHSSTPRLYPNLYRCRSLFAIIVGENEKTKIKTTIGTKIKNEDDRDEDRDDDNRFGPHVLSNKYSLRFSRRNQMIRSMKNRSTITGDDYGTRVGRKPSCCVIVQRNRRPIPTREACSLRQNTRKKSMFIEHALRC